LPLNCSQTSPCPAFVLSSAPFETRFVAPDPQSLVPTLHRSAVALVVSLFVLAGLSGCSHKKVQTRAPTPAPAPRAPSRPTRVPEHPVPTTAPTAPSIVPQPAPPATEPERTSTGQLPISVSPLVRIGLTTGAREIRIGAAEGFYFQEKSPEASREFVRGELRIRVEQPATEGAEVFRVQVAAFTREEAAEELRQQLVSKLGMPAVLRESASGVRQVRVGEFKTREEAQEFASGPLVEAGFGRGIPVRETASRTRGEPQVALSGPDRLFRLHRGGYFFFPTGDSDNFLLFDGKPFRGLLDVSLNRSGLLTVVNRLPTEEYLFGVVPSEISPTTYPAMAALEAQAVAARTYTLRNMGKFKAEGFDLSNDVRSQVYGGVAAEREPTTQAVRDTYGIAVFYEGRPIDAMYMSTCGGRTESFSAVFDGAPVPYLQSVGCSIEDSGEVSAPPSLVGQNDLDEVITGDDGSALNRDLELAAVLGLTGNLSVDFLNESATPVEVKAWVDSAARIARRPMNTSEGRCPSPESGIRAAYLAFAACSFFGQTEIERRLSQSDVDYYLANLRDGSEIPVDARRPLAYLMQAGLWRPGPDNRARPRDPLRRASAVAALARWIDSTRQDLLRTGVLQDASGLVSGSGSTRTILIKGGTRSQAFVLAPKVRLFRVSGTTSMPAGSLRLIGNERLRFHTSSSNEIDLLEVELNPTGASSDRFSPVATWESTLTRAAISEKLRPLAPAIGEIRDLKPARLGASGRSVKIEVIGSRGSVVLNGYRVRGALGLRDTLFTITRQHGPDGSVESFTFKGRGWGHGVGLCQVGAYGMARAGRSFGEILKTYYQGVEIRKAY
jgi:stage II sporulation protein D